MSGKASRRPGFFRRRTYIVDRPWQYGMIFTLLGAMMVTAFLIVTSYYVLPAAEVFGQLTGEQIRDIILKLNASFFGITLTVAGMIMILLSHRVAGPAMVLERAVRGFLQGDYSGRTKLRKKDYLQDLAGAIGEVGQRLETEEQTREEFVRALQRKLEQGDLEAVRAVVAEFSAGCASEEPVDAPAMAEAHEDQPAEPAPSA